MLGLRKPSWGCGTGVETCKVRMQPGKELVELHHVQQSVQV